MMVPLLFLSWLLCMHLDVMAMDNEIQPNTATSSAQTVPVVLPISKLSYLVFDYFMNNASQLINLQEKIFERTIKPLSDKFSQLPQDLKNGMFAHVLNLLRPDSIYYGKTRYILAALVKAGTDPNVVAERYTTFLHAATARDDVESVRLLSEHNAQFDITTRQENPAARYVKSVPMATLFFERIQDMSYFSH